MLSKTSKQLINALVELAKLSDEQWLGTKDIAQRIGAPQNYLGKSLQALSSRGIVQSQRGLHGGFRLKKDPETITLYEVVDPIDQISQWSTCILGLQDCSDLSPCPAHDKWKSVKDAYMEFLKNTTIAGLVEKGMSYSDQPKDNQLQIR